jgi:DNA-binding phage protein
MPSREALEKVEGNIRVVQSWSNAVLADATEQYLVGAREILRRRADASRLTRKAAASRAALSAHMGRAGNRDLPWIRAAADLKKQVERDHFDLDVQLSALADLLDLLPEANKRLAPHVQASLLLEEGRRRAAREAIFAEAKRANTELDKARVLLR